MKEAESLTQEKNHWIIEALKEKLKRVEHENKDKTMQGKLMKKFRSIQTTETKD